MAVSIRKQRVAPCWCLNCRTRSALPSGPLDEHRLFARQRPRTDPLDASGIKSCRFKDLPLSWLPHAQFSMDASFPLLSGLRDALARLLHGTCFADSSARIIHDADQRMSQFLPIFSHARRWSCRTVTYTALSRYRSPELGTVSN